MLWTGIRVPPTIGSPPSTRGLRTIRAVAADGLLDIGASLVWADCSSVQTRRCLHVRPPDVANRIALGEGVARVERVLGDSGDPAGAAERRDDGLVRSDLGFGNQPTRKDRSQNALVNE